MLLLIDNYDSFTYNLAQYFGELGQEVRVVRNDEVNVAEIERMEPRRIVISPGPCTPDQAGISMEVVKHFAGTVGIFGVCLGHQSIGQVFGGNVINAKEIMHGKISKIFHNEDGVFKGLENPFEATRYHSLVVEAETLPDCLVVTAKTWDDEIMALEHKKYAGTKTPVVGVQFHPESIMTKCGLKILQGFLDQTR